MKNTSFLLLAAFFFQGFYGCSKSSDDNNSSSDISSIIQITSPTEGGIYFNGSIMQVRGTISDPNGLSTAKLEIRTTGGSVLYTNETSTGSVTYYNLNWNWTVSGITTSTPVTVIVTAKDYNAKLISKQVSLTLTD